MTVILVLLTVVIFTLIDFVLNRKRVVKLQPPRGGSGHRLGPELR